jgi:tetratricopeptide (TPR) repeat protein
MSGQGIYTHLKIRRLLYDYCLGLLEEADEQRVEEHLLDCDDCQRQVEERLSFATWLHQHPDALVPARGKEPAASSWNRLWSWHRGWAAVVATTLLLVVPVGVVAYLSTIQNARFAMEMPQVDALKSLDGDDQSFHSGIAAFQEQRFQQALTHFSAYLKHAPDNFDANFFSGLCYLELSKQNLAGVTVRMDRDKALKGISLLEKARRIATSLQEKTGNQRYYADSTYYLGKAYYMLGDRGQAKQYFQLYLNVDEPILAHREEVRNLLKSIP